MMNHDEFEAYLETLSRDDYLNDDARNYLAQLPIEFDESDGLDDHRRDKPTLLSRSFSGKNDYYKDEEHRPDVEDEHRVKIRDAIQTTADLQRYQVYDGNRAIDHILVIEAEYGMEAVAMFQ